MVRENRFVAFGGIFVELLVLILNKVECLGEILAHMMEAGISGATVVDSQGMLTVLGKDDVEAPPIFGSLRQFLNPERESSKMVLVVLNQQQVACVRAIVGQVVGSLGQPNTGILFTMPLSYVEGVTIK